MGASPLRHSEPAPRRSRRGKKVKASIAMESAGYVTTTKRLLDGVANEFELEADPFFGGTRGPSFLELDAESLKAIVESLE